MSRPNFATIRSLLLALASAIFLVLSFPNFNRWWCAWFALVPWLALVRVCTPRAAFRWSFLIGMAFFLASLWWLTYVTVVGWIALCVVLGVFFGIFGWLIARLGFARTDASAGLHVSTSGFSLVLVPAIWVAIEFLRSYLFSGFGWNSLGYSQTSWRTVIQFADTTGVWGVSFLVVMVNSALASLFHTQTPKSVAVRNLVVAGTLVAAAAAYGAWRIPQVANLSTARIAVVQGSIPQDQKWDAAYQAKIIERYTALTKAAAATRPDLIIWPETSVPGYFGVDEEVTQWVLQLATAVQRPLLVGTPIETIQEFRVVLKNAVVLVDAAGTINAQHAKLHLVPFGEYVPFDTVLPWLRRILPEIGMFTPGSDYTVFRPGGLPPVGVLICFEDVFPNLARRFIQRGAQMLVVITNDAWFGPTAAAYQHTQASTFRAIELRVPVVRAGNTGWSGCIDATGRWLGSVHDERGRELFVPGTYTCDVPRAPASRSGYLRWGDWFASACLLLTLSWLGLHLLLGRREPESV